MCALIHTPDTLKAAGCHIRVSIFNWLNNANHSGKADASAQGVVSNLAAITLIKGSDVMFAHASAVSEVMQPTVWGSREGLRADDLIITENHQETNMAGIWINA